MKLTVTLLAFALAAAASAQVPQNMGAADPSQQLKSMNMDPTSPNRVNQVMSQPIVSDANQNAQPLVTVDDTERANIEPGGPRIKSPMIYGAPLPPRREAPPVTTPPEPGSTTQREKQDKVGAGVTGWNPATNPDDPGR